MRLLCEVPPHVTASLLNKAEHGAAARKLSKTSPNSKAHSKATPSSHCSMECPSRRLIDTQYSCAAEGRKEQQPWENALYRVNTLLLNHKTVDQAKLALALALALALILTLTLALALAP